MGIHSSPSSSFNQHLWLPYPTRPLTQRTTFEVTGREWSHNNNKKTERITTPNVTTLSFHRWLIESLFRESNFEISSYESLCFMTASFHSVHFIWESQTKLEWMNEWINAVWVINATQITRCKCVYLCHCFFLPSFSLTLRLFTVARESESVLLLVAWIRINTAQSLHDVEQLFLLTDSCLFFFPNHK